MTCLSKDNDIADTSSTNAQSSELILAASVGDFFRSLGDGIDNLLDGNGDQQEEKEQETTTNTASPPKKPTIDFRGLTREQNREIQELLTKHGYSPGPADGLPGNKTKSAIRAYQEDNGLSVDGLPSESLLQHLSAKSTPLDPITTSPDLGSHSVSTPVILQGSRGVADTGAAGDGIGGSDSGSRGLDPDGSFLTVEVHPGNPDIVFAGSTKFGLGIYRSSDGGRTWEDANSGIKKLGLGTKRYPPISKIQASSGSGVVYLGTGYQDPLFKGGSGKVYRSKDYGKTWTEVTGKKSLIGIPQLQGAILDLAVDSKNSNRVVVGTGGQGVFLTNDAGETWEKIIGASAPIGKTDYYNITRFNAKDPKQIIVSGFSDYTGNTIPNPGCFFGGCDNTGKTFPGTTGKAPIGLQISRDDGKTWNKLAAPGLTLITDIEIDASSNTIYASTRAFKTPLPGLFGENKGVLKSSDFGATWTQINDKSGANLSKVPILSLELDPKSSTIFSVKGIPGELFYSENGGLSWKSISKLSEAKNESDAYALSGLPSNIFIGDVKIQNDRILVPTTKGLYIDDFGQVESSEISTVTESEIGDPSCATNFLTIEVNEERCGFRLTEDGRVFFSRKSDPRS